jgi:hypothetical protein
MQSRHHWLLTVAAEGVVRLMYPLKYQHVYIPALPSTLVEYLEVGDHTKLLFEGLCGRDSKCNTCLDLLIFITAHACHDLYSALHQFPPSAQLNGSMLAQKVVLFLLWPAGAHALPHGPAQC